MASTRLADTGQPYRAAWWLTWIFAVGFVVSMLGNVTLGAVIIRMLPLKEVVPMLLTTSDRTNQVVRVEPWETRTHGRQLLVETIVKRYVELRETIDLHTEVPRWQEVSWLSSDDIWADFRKLMDKSNPDSPFEKRKKDRVTRDVKALLVAEVSPDVYQVEWEAQDMAAGSDPRGRGVWVSTISVAFSEKAVRFEDRYMNPVGLQVVGYSVSKKQ